MRDGKMFVGIVKDQIMARVGKEVHAVWVKKKTARHFVSLPKATWESMRRGG